MKINWVDHFKYYANVPFNMRLIIKVLKYESYQLLIMVIFNVFFYKIHICNYDDQGVDAKSISSKSEFTWIYFVKFFQLTFKFFTENKFNEENQYFQKFGFTLNHLDIGIF